MTSQSEGLGNIPGARASQRPHVSHAATGHVDPCQTVRSKVSDALCRNSIPRCEEMTSVSGAEDGKNGDMHHPCRPQSAERVRGVRLLSGSKQAGQTLPGARVERRDSILVHAARSGRLNVR